jgi:hypothetical protein
MNYSSIGRDIALLMIPNFYSLEILQRLKSIFLQAINTIKIVRLMTQAKSSAYHLGAIEFCGKSKQTN